MKPAHLVAMAFFALLAGVQTLRLIMGWAVSVNGVTIPMWPSAVAIVVLLGLAAALWREARGSAA